MDVDATVLRGAACRHTTTCVCEQSRLLADRFGLLWVSCSYRPAQSIWQTYGASCCSTSPARHCKCYTPSSCKLRRVEFGVSSFNAKP